MFSVPTLDIEVWRRTEPGTAPPRQRLRALSRLVEAGIRASVGMAPILPGISDRPEQLAAVVRAAREAGACGIWANVLYLRPGTREHFLECLAHDWPELLPEYERLYGGPRVPAAPDRPRPRRGPRARARRGDSRSPARALRARPRPEQLSLASENRAASGARNTIALTAGRDHDADRRRPRGRPRRAPPVALARPAHPGRRRGRRRSERDRAGAAPQAGRRDHGRPHAGDGRARGDRLAHRPAPETKVLIFTAYSERSLLGRGFDSGATGYILKEAPHETLVRAIEKVAAGEGYVDPALMPPFLAGRDQSDMLTAARAGDPPAARRRPVERRRRREALHLAGDRQEPRPPHPHQARSRHAHPRRRDRAPRRDHRLSGVTGWPSARGSTG